MSVEYYLRSSLPNPTICNLFEAAAFDTWSRIKFSRSTPRMKIHETTITQNLVYEMRLLKNLYPLQGFTLYESVDEKTNGDDLELCVLHTNGRIYKYALQAKIIYHAQKKRAPFLQKGSYPQLKHYVGKGARKRNQIDLLLNYATDKGCIPLYLLYNYINRPIVSRHYARQCFGCTVVSAYYLKRNHAIADGNLKSTVKFADLHPSQAIPWQDLVCKLSTLDNEGLIKKFGLDENYIIANVTLPDLINDPQWMEEEIDVNSIDNNKSNFGERIAEFSKANDNSTLSFKPKFRIIAAANDQF